MRRLYNIIEAAKAGAYEGNTEILVADLLLAKHDLEKPRQEPRRVDWERAPLLKPAYVPGPIDTSKPIQPNKPNGMA